jgi:hypothetical protein
LVLGLALVTLAGPAAAACVSMGTAYSPDGERVLYREQRTEQRQDGELVACEVDYLTPEGELFAEKTIRFDGPSTAPAFTFVDYREEFREGARPVEDVIELYSGVGEDLERRRRELPEGAVVDAGFDRFIRENFDRLRAGERLEFEFAVPAEQRFVRFEIESEGETTYDGRPALALRMRPASFLVRLLVEPIRLVYDEQRRLLEFAGISDIRDDQGDRHVARVVFEYPQAGGAAARGL